MKRLRFKSYNFALNPFLLVASILYLSVLVLLWRSELIAALGIRPQPAFWTLLAIGTLALIGGLGFQLSTGGFTRQYRVREMIDIQIEDLKSRLEPSGQNWDHIQREVEQLLSEKVWFVLSEWVTAKRRFELYELYSIACYNDSTASREVRADRLQEAAMKLTEIGSGLIVREKSARIAKIRQWRIELLAAGSEA